MGTTRETMASPLRLIVLILACSVAFGQWNNEVDDTNTHHGGKGKHHRGKGHYGKVQADDNGCVTKEDGVWCPQEDGTWVRDDGKVFYPQKLKKDDADKDEDGCYQKDDGLWCPDGAGGWFLKKPHHHHRFKRMCRMQMLGYLFGAFVLLIGLIWGYFERKRRCEAQGEKPTRLGAYVTSLWECFGRPAICLPACLFTPILAAFNRAEADDRECTFCDVCFSMMKPVAQYTTRQTIRSKHSLADANVQDMLAAVCCTPCAIAQDTIELEKRSMMQQADAPATHLEAPGMPPVYMVAATAPPQAEVVMTPVTKADDQV